MRYRRRQNYSDKSSRGKAFLAYESSCAKVADKTKRLTEMMSSVLIYMYISLTQVFFLLL